MILSGREPFCYDIGAPPRHLYAYLRGEERDRKRQLHLASVAARAMMIIRMKAGRCPLACSGKARRRRRRGPLFCPFYMRALRAHALYPCAIYTRLVFGFVLMFGSVRADLFFIELRTVSGWIKMSADAMAYRPQDCGLSSLFLLRNKIVSCLRFIALSCWASSYCRCGQNG